LSVIFGIDPGSRITGYGVVEETGGGLRCLGFGQVRAPASGSRAEKLKKIYNGLSSAIESWRPDVIVVETVYAGRNVQSALEASHARGVALLAAAESGAQVCEYSPSEIKRAVVGNGSATKAQVQFMVERLLSPKKKPKADEADALAVAVCHLNRVTGGVVEQGDPGRRR
jgi:crossover junction endodeoxyribonuclease RuvC